MAYCFLSKAMQRYIFFLNLQKMNDFYKQISDSKLIIFDLGNVLIDVDVRKSIEAYKNIGVSNVENILTNSAAIGGVFADLERGLISISDFCESIRQMAKKNILDIDIINALNAMIGSFPIANVRLIERLKVKHTVVLLSNTNEIHKKYFDALAEGYASLSDLFDKTWYSHEMHMSKPSQEIFNKVLDYHGVKPNKAVFFDDSITNVNAARQLGITSFNVNAENTLEKFFSI